MIKMWNEPTKKQLQLIPKLYSQEKEKDPKVYMKLFLGEWTWFITEIDHENFDTMFCLVESPNTENGEWGYSSLSELKSIKKGFVEIDRDIYGVHPRKPKRLSELRGR